MLLLLLLLHFIRCEGHLSPRSLLPTSAIPCLLCARLLLGMRLLLGTSLFFPLLLLDDFLNTRLLAIINYFPRTLHQPLFSRASSWSRGYVEEYGTGGHPRLRRRSIKGPKPLLSSKPLSLGRSNAAPPGWRAILLLSPSVHLQGKRKSRLQIRKIDVG